MAPRDALPPSTADEIDAYVADWRAAEDVPGVSVAVTDAGATRHATAVGVRDRETGAPATPDTLYGVASLTKPVTATAVCSLVDRGALALDDAVRDHVPLLADVPGPAITVRELLSHSSGLPQDFVAQREGIDDGRDLGTFEHIAELAQQRLTDRDRYMYSNGGYFLLGELVEAVDGRPYPTYAREEVLAPLGMDRSTFDPAVLEEDDDAMTGYVEGDDGLVPEALERGAGPAGGLVSSATELARLLRCVLNDGALDGTRVLSPSLVDAMCTRQSPPLPTADGSDRGYGFGWEVREFLGETLVSHLGGIGVSSAFVGVLPEREVGVAVALNTHGPPVPLLGRALLALACGESPDEAVPMLAVREAVDDLAGRYEAFRGATAATVEPGPAGTLTVRLPERDVAFTVSPDDVDPAAGEYAFSTVVGDGARWTVEFRGAEAGTRMVLSMGKWTSVLTRA